MWRPRGGPQAKPQAVRRIPPVPFMTRQRKNFPELDAWLPQVQAAVIDYLSRFVRALALANSRLEPEAWASAVPVTLAGRPILLTAKHALDRAADRPILLETPSHFLPIRLDPALRADSDEIDSTAIALPKEAFDWGIEFLVLEDQHEPRLTERDIEIFVALGFPFRESTVNRDLRRLELRPVSYWAFEAVDAYRPLRLDKTKWVAMRFDRKGAYRGGYRQAMKLPHGMSGGALWRLWGPRDQVPSPPQVALAGILIEHRTSPAKCILSARLTAVRSLARNLLV